MKKNQSRTFSLQKKVMPYIICVSLSVVGVGCVNKTEKEIEEIIKDRLSLEQSIDNNKEEIVAEDIIITDDEVIIQQEDKEKVDNEPLEQEEIIINNDEEVEVIEKPIVKEEPLAKVITPSLDPTPVMDPELNPLLRMTFNEIWFLYEKEFLETLDSGHFAVTLQDGYILYKKYRPSLPILTCVVHVNMGLLEDPYPPLAKTRYNIDALPTSLVNKYNHINVSDDYFRIEELEPVTGEDFILRNEARLAYEQMREDAKAKGVNLKLIGAYRTYEEQEAAYNEVLKGKTQAQADQLIARPGYSENELGYSIELPVTENSIEYRWLQQNAEQYGFILRHPKDKEMITQFKFNPQLYRYVGPELAKKVNQSGLSFGEYYHQCLRPYELSHYNADNNYSDEELTVIAINNESKPKELVKKLC